MVKKADIPRHLVDTALAAAAERGWQSLSLNDIADAAGLPLSKVYPVFGSKRAILDAFAQRIDEQVLAGQPKEWAEEDTPRDRLFDVMMRRIDALTPHKAGVGAVMRSLGRDPVAALCGTPQLVRSMSWMLEAAGIDSHGPAGVIRTRGLALLWLSTLQVWLADDTPDAAKTMAALDARLRRADRWAATFTDPPRRAGPRKEAEESG
ncbi:MAG: TetR family transcriptional regulator [Kiloniellales bacterium]